MFYWFGINVIIYFLFCGQTWVLKFLLAQQHIADVLEASFVFVTGFNPLGSLRIIAAG
jgi:hypothetical protein